MGKESTPSISPEEQEKLLKKKRKEAWAQREMRKGMDELAPKSDKEVEEGLKKFGPDEKEKKEKEE